MRAGCSSCGASAADGKTMHVRWLIARRCVPAKARIPCARIDFDQVDPIAATREPYLVLLAMAEQLDRQLPGDAFGKLVRTYGADLVRLYRRAGHDDPEPRDEGFSRGAGPGGRCR